MWAAVSDCKLSEIAIERDEDLTCGESAREYGGVARVRRPIHHMLDVMSRVPELPRSPPRHAIVEQELQAVTMVGSTCSFLTSLSA